MKPENDRTPSRPSAPPSKRRFRIERLEERVAPKRGGKGTKNCGTYDCSSGAQSSGSY